MSLEQALAENTAQLKRVADLLEISNADRAKLIEQNVGAGASAPTTTSSDNSMTVAEVKAALADASLESLKQMLADEENGKARKSAIDAIKAAIDAAGEAEAATDEAKTADGEAEAAEQEEAKEEPKAEEKPAASTDDKNAQPVPAEVGAEAVKKMFGGWLTETDDTDERATRRAFVAQVTDAIGGKVSEVELEGRRKAVFFLRRKRAGMDVNFSAAFDFDGSPTQDEPSADSGAASEDDDGLL